MFCADCGKEIKPGSKFCVFCGGTVAEPPGDRQAGAAPAMQAPGRPAQSSGGGAAEGPPPPRPGTPSPPVPAQPVAPVYAPVQPAGGGGGRNWNIVVLIVLIVVALAGVAVALVLTLGGGDKKEGATAPTAPSSGTSKYDFKPMDIDTTEPIASISPLDDSHLWAVGGKGTILFFDGSSWKNQESFVTVDLNYVYALDESHVWAVGEKDTILFFDGSTWKKQETGLARDPNGPPVVPDYLDSVYAADETHVWAVGGIIINQDSVVLFFDGTSWKSQEAPGAALHSVWGPEANDVWAVGGLGTAIHWDGSSWTESDQGIVNGTAPFLWAVVGSDSDDMWAASTGKVFHYDGKSWSAQSVGGKTGKWAALETNGEEVWAVGDAGAFATYDGKAWKNSGIGTKVNLYCVAISGEYIWITGDEGTILRAEL